METKRRVLVTGSGRGIGAAIAHAFAADGTRLFVCARSERELVATADELRVRGAEVIARSLDLREPDAAARVVGEAVAAWGGLDVVVTNAGATSQGGFLDLADEDWAEGFSLKVFANLRVIKEAWPHLSRSNGSVVMIGGGTARVPDPRVALVSAVNGSLAALAKAIAEQGYADGVQVNLVQPGTIRTSRRARLFEKFGASEGKSAAEYEATLASRLRVARLGEPSDVAAVVRFLCSPEARFIHGITVDVDGGQNKSI